MLDAPVKSVHDVMTRELVTVDGDTTLTEAARLMTERRVGAALVFDGERLAGILTERDVLRAVADGRLETRAADAMTARPETVEPSESASHAATLMIHGGFRHLPVVERDAVVGIVSIRDLVREVLDDQAPRGA
jgi:CBS domain-containing protein